MEHKAIPYESFCADPPVDMNDRLGALTAIELHYPETFSKKAWKVIRYMEGAMYLYFYKGKYVATDESLWLTDYGEIGKSGPIGGPRWTGDSLEEFEQWLEELADYYEAEGDIPGWTEAATEDEADEP